MQPILQYHYVNRLLAVHSSATVQQCTTALCVHIVQKRDAIT